MRLLTLKFADLSVAQVIQVALKLLRFGELSFVPYKMVICFWVKKLS